MYALKRFYMNMGAVFFSSQLLQRQNLDMDIFFAVILQVPQLKHRIEYPYLLCLEI